MHIKNIFTDFIKNKNKNKTKNKNIATDYIIINNNNYCLFLVSYFFCGH